MRRKIAAVPPSRVCTAVVLNRMAEARPANPYFAAYAQAAPVPNWYKYQTVLYACEPTNLTVVFVVTKSAELDGDAPIKVPLFSRKICWSYACSRFFWRCCHEDDSAAHSSGTA